MPGVYISTGNYCSTNKGKSDEKSSNGNTGQTAPHIQANGLRKSSGSKNNNYRKQRRESTNAQTNSSNCAASDARAIWMREKFTKYISGDQPEDWQVAIHRV